MLLFFGCRHPKHDHIYKQEMDEWVRQGVLTRCYTAYSRSRDEKEYVQHQASQKLRAHVNLFTQFAKHKQKK